MANEQEQQLYQQYIDGKVEALKELEQDRIRLAELGEEDYKAALQDYRAKLNLWFEEWEPWISAYATTAGATSGAGISWWLGGPLGVLGGALGGGVIGLSMSKTLLRAKQLAAKNGMTMFSQEPGRISLKLAPDDQVIALIKEHIMPHESQEYERQIKSEDADDFKKLFSNVCDNLSKRLNVGKFTIGLALVNLFAALNLGTPNDIPATADLRSLGEYHVLEEIRESEKVSLIKLELMVKATETTAKCCWMFCQGKKDITFKIKYRKWTFENYTKFQETYRLKHDTKVQTGQTTTQDDPESVTSTL